jgi:uncharacterized membrane protein
MAGQALQEGCQEVERLKECLSAAKTALGAVDGEAADARAANVAAHAKLTGELNFVMLFVDLFLALVWQVLNLRLFQRHRII